MNNTARALAALGCATLFVAGSTGAQSANLASANGQGTLNDGARTFSFNAKRLADGSVTGQAVLTNRSFNGANGTSPYKLHIDISCMKKYDDRTAVFGGTTKSTNDPNLVDAAYFTVQDNGEPGKAVDKISRVVFFDDDPTTTGDPQLCLLNEVDDGYMPLEPIEKGNIQVR